MTTEGFTLWQTPGWGSALVEAQLAAYGLPVELVEAGDLFADAAARAAVEKVNPLGQIPVLRLPSGEVMTESAAITLHLADLAGSDLLVPGPAAAERAAFLRWLVWLVANVYPCFTFADEPTRFVSGAEAPAYRERVDDRLRQLWRIFSDAAAGQGGPWVLGTRFSALDIYVAVMTHWRPRRDWFAAETPALAAIADRCMARPELEAAFRRNFG